MVLSGLVKRTYDQTKNIQSRELIGRCLRLLEEYKNHLKINGASQLTIKSYMLKVEEYLKWYGESFNLDFQRLYRENVVDYLSYLQTVKKDIAKTINTKISALIRFNEFLCQLRVQEKMVVYKNDRIRIQEPLVSPTKVNKVEVEQFRQRILEEEGAKYYCITTIAAYCGLRISEILAIELNDFNFTTRELIVNKGKGNKMRVVYMNQKAISAIKEYLKERKGDSSYLFPSEISSTGKMHPSSVNKVFNKYSDLITPHDLRHHYATMLVNSRFSISEVAAQLGHANVHTTLRYSHTNRNEIIEKIDNL